MDDIAINCFRFFGFQSIEQVLNLDFHEYRLLCQAHRLKNVDEDYRIHEAAFLNNKATLRDKKSRLIYSSFKKFFDYKKQIREAAGDKPEGKTETLSGPVANYRRYLRMKGGGANGRET
jgi:hypothetical protein